MMTREEFIEKYHDYNTQSRAAAMIEARTANVEGVLGDRATAVCFGKLGYGLMLQSAVELLGMKLEPEEETE